MRQEDNAGHVNKLAVLRLAYRILLWKLMLPPSYVHMPASGHCAPLQRKASRTRKMRGFAKTPMRRTELDQWAADIWPPRLIQMIGSHAAASAD